MKEALWTTASLSTALALETAPGVMRLGLSQTVTVSTEETLMPPMLSAPSPEGTERVLKSIEVASAPPTETV